MKKKRRVPERKQSAFESARAALERAGEEEPPVSAETPETVENAETSAPVSATTDNAEASATADETADSAEASAPVPATTDDAETSAPVSATTDNAEASAPATETADDAETSAPVSATTDDAETPVPVATDSAETSATPEATETPETSATADGAETPVPAFATADGAETPATPETLDAESADDAPDAESDADASAPVTTDSAETADVSQDATSAPLTDSSEDEADEKELWEMEDEEPEPENVDTERNTMETKEITLGYRRSSAQSDGREAEAVKTPKSRFKALDQLKDAFRTRADAPEYDDGNPSSGSSRDAALRKRVMQIEDDETRNYLLDRVLPQMAWYSKKIARYRTMYYRLMTATILLGALIPVFSVGGSYGAVKVIIALLGASVTAINAYIGLHNYRDLWLTYQTTRETLVHTLYCYFNQAGVFSYNNLSMEDLNILLVNVCEDTLSKEHGGWTTILQKT